MPIQAVADGVRLNRAQKAGQETRRHSLEDLEPFAEVCDRDRAARSQGSVAEVPYRATSQIDDRLATRPYSSSGTLCSRAQVDRAGEQPCPE